MDLLKFHVKRDNKREEIRERGEWKEQMEINLLLLFFSQKFEIADADFKVAVLIIHQIAAAVS